MSVVRPIVVRATLDSSKRRVFNLALGFRIHWHPVTVCEPSKPPRKSSSLRHQIPSVPSLRHRVADPRHARVAGPGPCEHHGSQHDHPRDDGPGAKDDGQHDPGPDGARAPTLTDRGISAHSSVYSFSSRRLLPREGRRGCRSARPARVPTRYRPRSRTNPPRHDRRPRCSAWPRTWAAAACPTCPRSRGADEEHEARGFCARVEARQDGPGHAEGSDGRFQEPEPSAAGPSPCAARSSSRPTATGSSARASTTRRSRST